MRLAAKILVSCALVALAACAPVRMREDEATLRAQAARESQLEKVVKWTLDARLAVSDGRDGGNGDLHWLQDGARFDLTVHAPVTGRTWRLHGEGRDFTLEGAAVEPLRGAEAEAVLARELGWEAPVAELAWWVRGLRAPGAKAELVFDASGRPAMLRQSGWQIEYRDWFAERTPALPRKMFATRGKSRVRMFVEDWSIDGEADAEGRPMP